MQVERWAVAGLVVFGIACWAPWSVDHPGHVQAGSTFTAEVGFVSGDTKDAGPVACVGLPDATWTVLEARYEGTTDGTDSISGDATAHEEAETDLASREGTPDVAWSCWSAPEGDYAEGIALDLALDLQVPAGVSGTQELAWVSWHGPDDEPLPAASLVRIDAPAGSLDHFEGIESLRDSPMAAVAWGAGRFVGVRSDGRVSTSPYGVLWSDSEPLATDLELLHIGYGGGRFVAFGDVGTAGDGLVAWSADGESWEVDELGGAPDCLRRGDGAWLMCIDGGYARVPDADWEAVAEGSLDPEVVTPAAAEGRSFADVHIAADGTALLWGGADDADYLRYDADDDDWTVEALPVLGAGRLARGDGAWVVVGVDPAAGNPDEAPSLAAVSTDGLDWTTHPLDNGLLGDVGEIDVRRQAWYIDGRFIAGEHGGTLRTSVDGATWTRHLTGAFLFLRDIARSDDGTWVALGMFGSIHRAVEAAEPLLPADAPPDAHETVPYGHDLAADGGVAPLVHALAGGALPAGLDLQDNGVLSGTPTEAGSFSFTVQVDDDWGRSAQADYTLQVVAAPAITTTALPGGRVGEAYSAVLEADGGAAPLVWTVSGDLPPGIALEGDTLAGTPTEAGTWDLTVMVADDAGAADEAELSIVVDEAPPPDDTGIDDEQQAGSGGCGCDAGATGGALVGWLLLPMLALRRRRS